jgi:hypothetical protein
MDELRQRPICSIGCEGQCATNPAPHCAAALQGSTHFTEAGIHSYVDDLVERMVNPFVAIACTAWAATRHANWPGTTGWSVPCAARVGRRNLPQRYAFGVAAAWPGNKSLLPSPICRPFWQPANPAAPEEQAMLALITQAQQAFASWQQQGHPPGPPQCRGERPGWVKGHAPRCPKTQKRRRTHLPNRCRRQSPQPLCQTSPSPPIQTEYV